MEERTRQKARGRPRKGTTKATSPSSGKGRLEPSSDPVWKERAESLAWLMVEPMTVPELHRAARHYFDFTSNRVTNALAWGDGIYFYFHPGDMKWRRYNHVKGMWP